MPWRALSVLLIAGFAFEPGRAASSESEFTTLPVQWFKRSPRSGPEQRQSTKMANFRQYQNSDWKLREPIFVGNKLTEAVEDLTLSNEERYKKVQKVLNDTIGRLEDRELLTHDDKLWLNHRKGYAIRRAADYGYTRIVKLLLQYGADANYHDSETIRLAAQNGHLDIVKQLYIEGSRWDSRQEYALRASSRLGHEAVVDFLLSKGADPRTYDGFALACTEDPNILQKLNETSIAQLNSEELAAWEYATNFGKYGDTYCSEFDYENLPYASAAKTSPGLLAAFSAFIIFLRQ